ncbi:uncharacterized protein METZ01_LOCUS31356, partial [marine metagenome]
VLLAGEPGIGKTPIAYELAHYAEAQGARLLWRWCYEGGGAPSRWCYGISLRERCPGT